MFLIYCKKRCQSFRQQTLLLLFHQSQDTGKSRTLDIFVYIRQLILLFQLLILRNKNLNQPYFCMSVVFGALMMNLSEVKTLFYTAFTELHLKSCEHD